MRAAFSLLVLLFGLFLTFWSAWPLQPAAVRSALLEAQQRFEAQQKAAADPARNGYLSPAYQALWIARDASSSRDPRLLLTKAAALYCPDTFPNVKRLRRLMQNRDPQLAHTLRAFAKFLPHLQNEWVKPFFVPPQSRPSLLAPLPNMSSLGDLQQAVSALSFEQVCLGHPEQGLRLLVPTLRLSTALIDNGTAQSVQAGLRLRRVAFQAFMRCLQSPAALEPSLARSLAEEARHNQTRPDMLRTVLLNEVLGAEEFFRPTRAAREELQRHLEAGDFWRLIHIPGMLRRDRRVYHQQIAPLLRPGALERDYGEAALARSSWKSLVGQVVMPDLRNTGAQLDLARLELEAVVTLLEQRAEGRPWRQPLRLPFNERLRGAVGAGLYRPETGVSIEQDSLVVRPVQEDR